MKRVALAGLIAAVTALPAGAQDASLTGYWQGKYDCAQGITGVTITIRQAADSGAEGLFLFYAVPENPDVPSGCYRLKGRYDPASREVRLLSDESQWLWQPPNYVTVNFIGHIEAFGARMRGQVQGPGCSVFFLERVPTAPPAPAPCTRAMNLSQRGDDGSARLAAVPRGERPLR